MKTIEQLTQEAIALLKSLIETQSFSSEQWFQENEIPFQRTVNNVWATNKHFEEGKPTMLLNSHHDTVKPNNGYTKDPFKAIVEDGKLYGLGSNDAGGPSKVPVPLRQGEVNRILGKAYSGCIKF